MENNQLPQVAQPDSGAKGGLSSLGAEDDTTELQHLDDLQKCMAIFDIEFQLSRGACKSKIEDNEGPSSLSFEKPGAASKTLQVPSDRQICTSSTEDQASSTLVGSPSTGSQESEGYRSQLSMEFPPTPDGISSGDSGEEVHHNSDGDGDSDGVSDGDGDGDGDGASGNNNNEEITNHPTWQKRGPVPAGCYGQVASEVAVGHAYVHARPTV
ncbi:uncharacterized protein FFNC_02871 [Fusarium fujikuroi]|nr:uncharacterized protein FFC1_03415 [Fusarium fujikuroi]SCO07264.1 uncharacterized protein FFM5_09039 [Fusarium fujikuroi]SCO32408.1 uncharacterized protein FFNC_02871 [Fusarium fujikuroi]